MATDYISREAAISEILSEPTDAHYPSWYAEKLKQIPTADVRPVVRGHWIDYNPDDWNDPRMKCSHCGSVALPLATDVFCSRCGADLRDVAEIDHVEEATE